MAIVTLRYWAAAKDAAGCAEEKVEARNLADALAAVVEARVGAGDPARLRAVIARSSFLVNGDPVGMRPPDSVLLPDDAVVEVLPPFAGG